VHRLRGLPQLRELDAHGCEKVFQEEVSSVDTDKRLRLEAALDFLRQDDVLVVTKLDRLARSVKHLLDITERLAAKGAALRIIGMGIDHGRLMLTLLGGIAQFEREIMLERQREGIDNAKAEGKYMDRKPTDASKAADLRRLIAEEGLSHTEAAKRVGVGRATAYRLIKEGA